MEERKDSSAPALGSQDTGTTAASAEPTGSHPLDPQRPSAPAAGTAAPAPERAAPRGEAATAGRDPHVEAKDRFGGINWGAGFFGWLVAIGMLVLLVSILGAVLAAIDATMDLSLNDTSDAAGTTGIVVGVTLLVILAVAYFTGGYVAGRMSRFDGARQGLAVWLIGLFAALLALAVGGLFGAEYNIVERADLPQLPVSTDEFSWAGVATALGVLVLSLLGALIGGKVGHRYHDKVDRVAASR